MRKGIQAVETAMEEAAKGGGGFSGRLGYFNLKADEAIAIRFITDMKNDVITLDFYEFINDVAGKPQNFAVAADVYGDVSDAPASQVDKDGHLIDWVLELGGLQKDFQTKDLVEPFPKTRSVALAVVQREVAAEGKNGRLAVSYEDDVVPIDTKNGKRDALKFIIVKQAYKNFWGPLKSHFDENGTICDRVYKIKRVGANTDTNYSFMEKTADEDWNYNDDSQESVAELQAQYGYGADKTDVADEDKFLFCPMTLDEWAQDSCSEQRVRYFLDEDFRAKQDAKNKSTEGDSASGGSDDADEAQAAPPPASNARLQDRMSRHVKK